MSKYAIFLDLDGTALSSHNHINQELVDTVGKLRLDGHKVFIATGRQYYSTLPFHQQLDLDTPVITMNGAHIYDKAGKLLFQTSLAPEFIKHILQVPDFAEKTAISFFDRVNLTVATSDDQNLNEFSYLQMPQNMQPNLHFCAPILENKEHFQDVASIFSILPPEHLSWADDIFLTYQDKNPQHQIQTRLVEKDITGTVSYYEYFPKTAFKSTGIAWVMEQFGLHDYKTMAFGDGINDPDMLAYVDHGVAMLNGCEEVHAVSNDTTTYNNIDNGVAEYLQKYFL